MECSDGALRIVSRRVVQPESACLSSDDGGMPSEPETVHLTPWDLNMISVDYIQKGVFLPKPNKGVTHVVDDLAASFGRALGRFYPFAGRLAVSEINDSASHHRGLVISLCCNGKGAEFIHAVVPDVTVNDITAGLYIPSVLWSFFPLNGLLSGGAFVDSRPLLAAQVTELADGVFVAVSLNHAVADGTTFWDFFNTWSEINRNDGGSCKLVTQPPVFDRCWFLDTCPLPITLPFSKLDDIIWRPVFPSVLECFFHFSEESIKKLKAKANAEMAGTATSTISSLQALLGHVWRAVCRVRGLSPRRETGYVLSVGCRVRVNGIPQGYTGNAVTIAVASATVRDLLDEGPGWAAWLLNRDVASFDETMVRDMLASWPEEPKFLYLEASRDAAGIVTGSSPRFDMYGNDFGWDRPMAVRSGAVNKKDGKVTVYEGCHGGGSLALEVCLSPEALSWLVADKEFMEMVSTA